MSIDRTAPREAVEERSPAADASLDAKAASSRRQLPVSEDTRLATEIRGLVEPHQYRASRIAYQYLRDAAEADEAVQDAFVKVFAHITQYREAWPFEVWFTRILINGCLDRRKSRARRERWFVPSEETAPADEQRASATLGAEANPEAQVLARERR